MMHADAVRCFLGPECELSVWCMLNQEGAHR